MLEAVTAVNCRDGVASKAAQVRIFRCQQYNTGGWAFSIGNSAAQGVSVVIKERYKKVGARLRS